MLELRQETVSVIQQEADIEPKVETVDFEEDAIIVDKFCVYRIMVAKRPQLILFHCNVKRAHAIE